MAKFAYIHFAKGEMLATLPSILPECQFVVLDIVKSEIKRPLLTQLETQMQLLGNIQEVAIGYAQKHPQTTVIERK